MAVQREQLTLFPFALSGSPRGTESDDTLKGQGMRIRLLLITAPLLLVASCGGGSSSTSSSSALSGNWQMTLLKGANPKIAKTESGFLVQNNDTITGSLSLIDTPCSGVGSVTGSVSGTNIALVITPTGLTVNLTGTVQANQSMSGNFTILASGCSGSESAPLTGTWTANLVATLQGTFTSNKTGDVWPITGKIAQGQNTGISNTTLTGNVAITGYCLAGATISGVVSGTNVVMELVNSSGVEIGQVSGTSALDGSSVKGTYMIIPQGPGNAQPCANGDSGTVTFTL